MKEIGNFKVETGEVIVSDPCYEIGTDCATELKNVKNGNWKAALVQSDEGDWGIRNAVLIAHHEDFKLKGFEKWIEASELIGVDSGQAGFYDKKSFRNNEPVGEIVNRVGFSENDLSEDGGKFYALNCDLTLETELRAGVMSHGVVSSTGFGDGGYPLFYLLNEDKQVEALKVVFID